MIKISVIIPVYNASPFLDMFVNSLINQTIKDVEFIFINDGSLDNSFEIIEEYSKKDNRIKLYNQKNNGVSSARNKGISVSKGEYLAFLDPDDYIEFDMLEKMYNLARKYDYDVVICNYIEHNLNENIEKKKDIFSLNKRKENNIIKEVRKELITTQSYGYVWNRIYKKSILKDNNINFCENISMREDLMFSLKIFRYAKSVGYMDNYFYHYFIRKNSAISKIHYNLYDMTNEIYQETLKCISEWVKNDNKYIESINFLYSSMFFDFSYNLINENRPYSYMIKKIDSIIKNPIFNKYKKDISKNIEEKGSKVFYLLPSNKYIVYIYLCLLKKYGKIKNIIKS